MSGGVDSSVAAALLVRQGYDVCGVTLQVWEHEDDSVAASKKWQERGCCKIGIAKYVAQRLKIPYEVVDQRQLFRQAVIDDFLLGYAGGTTPNPCVRCNERVKLRGLVALAEQRGIEYVATGHYVRVQQSPGMYVLRRSLDEKKDQSYFLYRIRPDWLPRLRFPVGGMHKSEVWAEAEALGLPVVELKESQEICFVSHGDYRTFIESEMPSAKKPGAFVDEQGRYLGRHDGVAFYTPGQRRGLGIASGQRLYVQQVQPSTNTVVLGSGEGLLSSTCHLKDLNVFDRSLLRTKAEVEVKVRYATPATPAVVEPLDDDTLRIYFQFPQRALSPGQSAVLYRDDQVIGGGIIQPF
jgi:tRNA-specific 2-thiouridylase